MLRQCCRADLAAFGTGAFIREFALDRNQKQFKENRKMRNFVAMVAVVAVMTVPSFSFAEEADASSGKTIVDIAAGNEDFSTLVAAVKAAGLVETLSSKGPFTVFAPTNDAFNKLPKGTVESLLKPENKDKLISILKYHVVSGKVMAADVVKLDEAKTVQGQAVKISTGSDGVTVNKSKVVKTDIEASNGVIHVIDSVLLPSDK